MGMTVDETIEFFKGLKSHTPQAKDARDVAIETMRKYQKIVDIVSLNGEEFKQCGLKELKEILEVIADRSEEGTETWNGIHAQITAPKGTFDKIFNDAEEDIDDI